jgi:3-hydroxyacyl-CoA dehydrogenase/enoyl-CoA hydratase/3-hydroxybutyryl-CoA epimerase
MPRLLGLEKSLDLILSGRTVDGKAAKKMGLVDKLAPKELLEQKAFAWAKELAKTKAKRPPKERDLKNNLLENIPGGKWVIFDQAKKKLLEKTKGNYPAPLKALEVIRKTYGGDLEKGLKIEAEGFAELVTTPECKNLISLFYLNEKIKKEIKKLKMMSPMLPEKLKVSLKTAYNKSNILSSMAR